MEYYAADKRSEIVKCTDHGLWLSKKSLEKLYVLDFYNSICRKTRLFVLKI